MTEHKDSYTSIFENKILFWLRELHEKYNINTSCYVFYRSGAFDLSQCTYIFADEFAKNSDWLKFGFHAFEPGIIYNSLCNRNILEDYNLTLEYLAKITGGWDSITDIIRLHCYSGTREQIKSLIDSKIFPLRGLLCADDRRKNYYLDESQNEYIYSHDYLRDDVMKIDLYATDLRAEFIKSISRKIREFASPSWNNQLDILSLFTHEHLLNKRVTRIIETLCEYARANNYEAFNI
mgnify:CR=1 FL=1